MHARYQYVRRRALGGLAVVALLMSGVSYAALQSQPVILTGNSIETASAGLQLSTDGSSYGASRLGFDFSNVIPGGPAVPAAGQPFYLKNTGSAPLALKVYVSNTLSNPGQIDLQKVSLLLTAVGSGAAARAYSLQGLIEAAASGGLDLDASSLPAGGVQQYRLQVSMASAAVTGSSATLGSIDINFSGIAQGN